MQMSDIRNIHVLLTVTSGHKLVLLAKRDIGDTEGSECSQACVAHCGRKRARWPIGTYGDFIHSANLVTLVEHVVSNSGNILATIIKACCVCI